MAWWIYWLEPSCRSVQLWVCFFSPFWMSSSYRDFMANSKWFTMQKLIMKIEKKCTKLHKNTHKHSLIRMSLFGRNTIFPLLLLHQVIFFIIFCTNAWLTRRKNEGKKEATIECCKRFHFCLVHSIIIYYSVDLMRIFGSFLVTIKIAQKPKYTTHEWKKHKKHHKHAHKTNFFLLFFLSCEISVCVLYICWSKQNHGREIYRNAGR